MPERYRDHLLASSELNPTASFCSSSGKAFSGCNLQADSLRKKLRICISFSLDSTDRWTPNSFKRCDATVKKSRQLTKSTSPLLSTSASMKRAISVSTLSSSNSTYPFSSDSGWVTSMRKRAWMSTTDTVSSLSRYLPLKVLSPLLSLRRRSSSCWQRALISEQGNSEREWGDWVRMAAKRAAVSLERQYLAGSSCSCCLASLDGFSIYLLIK